MSVDSDLDVDRLLTQTDILLLETTRQKPDKTETQIRPFARTPIPPTPTSLPYTLTSIPSTSTSTSLPFILTPNPSASTPNTSTQTDQRQGIAGPTTTTEQTATPSSSSTTLPPKKTPTKKSLKRKPMRMAPASKSDVRAAEFLKVQVQQNQILETLAKAMLQGAQNEAESIAVRRQAVENTAKLYDRLGELIGVLKDGFDQKKQ